MQFVQRVLDGSGDVYGCCWAAGNGACGARYQRIFESLTLGWVSVLLCHGWLSVVVPAAGRLGEMGRMQLARAAASLIS